MKPMLAETWDEGKQQFPVLAQPKIDGVRALNIGGHLTGRSLKTFKNRYVTQQFSSMHLRGLDGEMACERDNHPDLCRITSSALGTIQGAPYVLWHVFDYVTAETMNMPYHQRYYALKQRLDEIATVAPHLSAHLRLIPMVAVPTMEHLLELDAAWLAHGYEGTILRHPAKAHKQGRSTVKEGGLLRIKRFVDFEFVVDEILEGEENQNEAQTNELGKTFRSSHQENKVANGMIGAMIGRTTAVVKEGSTVLFEKGQEVKVSAGCLTHEQRRHFFINQDLFKEQIHKAKFFPKGIKDKPRFPTWQSFRDGSDIS